MRNVFTISIKRCLLRLLPFVLFACALQNSGNRVILPPVSTWSQRFIGTLPASVIFNALRGVFIPSFQLESITYRYAICYH